MLTSVAAPFIKLRNLEPSPGDGYTITTDANGVAYWITSVSGAINVALTPIAYVPTLSGNVSNLNEVVTDPNSDVWIIDSAGDAVKVSGSGGGGGGLPSFASASLDVSGETSMFVRYSGTSAPVLTKTGAGQFVLTIPSGTLLFGFHWTGNNTNLTGTNTIELSVVSSAGNKVYAVYQVVAAATGEHFGELAGIVTKQTIPTAGTVKAVFPNMSSFGVSGFIIVGKPV